MANKKISELDELTSVVDADVVLINDADASTATKSKWATVANLMVAAPVQSVAGKSGVVTLDYTTDLINTPTTITGAQASAITANTAKVSFPGLGTTAGTALAGDTAILALGTTSSTALAGDTTTISAGQASAITANTAKVTFPGFGTIAGKALEGNTSLGTAAALDAGTANGNVVVLNSTGLPAVDGSLLTNLPGGLILGTIAGTALEGDTTTISASQASAITANTAKVTFPGFGTSGGTALEGDTSLLALGTSSSTALAGDTTTISAGQASAITANTAKVTNVPVASDAIWDSAGDLAVASGADTASKLAIGTAGQVLTVNAGATDLEWAAASGGGGGGVSALTVNAQTGTTYTIVAGDLGKLVTFSNSSAIAVTVPSGLGAGFYCYVQQLDEGQVNFLGTKNERNQTCLSKNALAMIASEAANEYVLSGDVTSFDNCITLVTDKKNATNYIAFDDASGNYYMGNGSTDWGGDYGQLTGTALSGNYKLMQTSDMNTAVDNALGGAGASTPNVENGGYATYNQEGNYDYYVYCGTGNTVTSVNVVDGSANSISIVPVLYRMKESSMQSIPIWGVTVYYDSSGSVYESYDSSGSNANTEYAVGWIDNPTPGRVYIGGHQSGSTVYGKPGSGTPEGYLYLD